MSLNDIVIPTKGSKYTDDIRKQAAISYAIQGNAAAVGRELGISETTLSDWRKQEWFVAITEEVRSQNADRITAQAQKIIDSATDITLEKLPDASAKDAATIGAIWYDKLRLSLSLPTSISSNNTSGQINALMDKFAELSQQWDEKQSNVVQVVEKIDEGQDSEGGEGQIRSD